MTILGFYFDIVRALEEIDAPYMLMGAFAGSGYGISRATFDIDMIVALREPDIDVLAHRFPPPRYYANPRQMRESTDMGIMFNIIDTNQGIKADLVPLSGAPEYRVAFSNRTRRTFQDETGESFQAWCAKPEDIILGKLLAWQEGKSAKHPNDIHEIAFFCLSGLNTEVLDVGYITASANRFGEDAGGLWRMILERVETEIASRK